MFEAEGKLVRIPMRFVDGEWVFEYGGKIPAKHGATAELVVRAAKLTDRKLVDQLLASSRMKILDQGTMLRTFVVVKDYSKLSDEQRKELIPWGSIKHQFAIGAVPTWSSEAPSFVELPLSNLTKQQQKTDPEGTGGLWLRLEGARPVGLLSSSIALPGSISNEPAISLNHAYTRLSETYEPWRKSHTGNVYNRFFYKEADDQWYPLELLRDAQVAEPEQAIAFNLWKALIARMQCKS